jgi:tetratricopeptide (TPR) repeat protein
MINTSIEEIAEKLANAKRQDRGVSLLIGAGCSKSSGIPLASEFVSEIEQRFNRAYQRAAAKTYPACMAALTTGERHDLIGGYVDQAKINWAHIAIAVLIKEGYVDRVLTTNFDPLIVRTCALLGVFPAVYDLAVSQLYRPEAIPDQAIFYLHGQRSGFVLLNTKPEVGRHARRLRPVFEDAGTGRVWIVVGYSGENDPVFEQLGRTPTFSYGLYWVGFSDEPSPRVRQKLLEKDKQAFFVGGQDADLFFISLAQQLGVFPPSQILRPFSHLKELFQSLTAFPLPGQTTDADFISRPRGWIARAISQYEASLLPTSREPGSTRGPSPDRAAAAQELLLAGNYEKVLELESELEHNPSEALTDALAWAHVMLGVGYANQAGTKAGAEADRLFEQAAQKYQAALAVKPDMHEALLNWGSALATQAGKKTGAEADRLIEQAAQKYQAALAVKPDMHEGLFNWANALATQAGKKTGVEADRLFEQATQKYQAALAVKPDMHEGLFNWANALATQAGTKTGVEADRLFEQAAQKYQAALAVKPDMHEALLNWGSALATQAGTKIGAEADWLIEQAAQKYQAALAIKPDMHEALLNWGIALATQAGTKTGVEADRLFEQAAQKYQAALAVKPDMHEALNNWGIALANRAGIKTGVEADRLFEQAAQKYKAALAVKPDMHEALNNWGIALANRAGIKTGVEADRLFEQAAQKYKAALAVKPDKHDALNNWGIALANRARIKTGVEADRLFEQAAQKYKAALAVKPDKHDALNNWGIALANQARIKTGVEADRLFEQAAQKYKAALAVKPDMHDALLNWGNALVTHARTKIGAEADQLFEQAEQKYQAALTIKSDVPDALNGWGTALLFQAATKTGAEARRLLRRARATLLRVVPQTMAAYNLACVSARLGDEKACREWLQKGQRAGTLPARQQILDDPDLESVRQQKWFQALIAKP